MRAKANPVRGQASKGTRKEGYIGVKFRSLPLSKRPLTSPRIAGLLKWCKKFHEMKIAPPYKMKGGSYGNMSFRDGKRMIVTASATALKNIEIGQFAKVFRAIPLVNVVAYRGARKPSSEAPLHYKLYKLRPDVNAIFHGHDPIVMKHAEDLGLVVTGKEYPYGTPKFFKEVLKHSKKARYVVWKGHGICSMGRTIKEAGEIAVRMHELAEKLERKEIDSKEAKSILRHEALLLHA